MKEKQFVKCVSAKGTLKNKLKLGDTYEVHKIELSPRNNRDNVYLKIAPSIQIFGSFYRTQKEFDNSNASMLQHTGLLYVNEPSINYEIF